MEVLRISTVVDPKGEQWGLFPFGSTKNFYCCRYKFKRPCKHPLDVLRISTVVDIGFRTVKQLPLEVLRISTVVDTLLFGAGNEPLEVLRISTVVDFV